MKFFRFVLLFFLLGIIGLAASPYFLGILTEQTIVKNILNIPESNKSFYKIELIEYDRGYFSSTARFEITINNPIKISDTVLSGKNFIITSKIYHGPLVKTRDFFNRWRVLLAYTESLIKPELHSFPPYMVNFYERFEFNLDSLITLSQNITTKLRVKPITFDEPTQKIHVHWNGIYALASFNKDISELNSRAYFGGINGNIQDQKISFNGLHQHNSWQKSSKYKNIWQGYNKTSMPLLELKSNTKNFILKSLSIKIDNNILDNRINSEASINIKKLEDHDFIVDDFSLQFSTADIDAKQFDNYVELARKFPQVPSYSDLSDQQKMMSQQVMQFFIDAFMLHGADVNLNIKFATQEGPSFMYFYLKAPETGEDEKIRINFNSKIPIKLIERIENNIPEDRKNIFVQNINSLIEQKFVIIDGDYYISKINIKDGTWEINGNTITNNLMPKNP